MVGSYRVITLCRSIHFKDAFMEAQKLLTLEGSIVLSPVLSVLSGSRNFERARSQFELDSFPQSAEEQKLKTIVCENNPAPLQTAAEPADYYGKDIRYSEPES